MADGTAEGVPAPSSVSRSPEAADLAKSLGVGADTAETLIQAGYTSVQSVRELSETALELLGVSTVDVERIRAKPAPAAADRTVENDRIVQRWVGTVRRTERPRRPRVTIPTKDSTDTLRKWVEGDDGAMEEWIQSSEPTGPAAAPVVLPTGAPGAPGSVRPAPSDEVVSPAGEREETVVRWLMGLLDRVKSDQFDPATLIQESQELHRQLYDERTKRRQLEEEVEHVKRGSIAVIKYVRSHEAKEKEIAVRSKDDEIAEMKLRLLALEGAGARVVPTATPETSAPKTSVQYTANAVEKATRDLEQRLRDEFSEREHAYIERETELRRRGVQLESEVRNLQSEIERTKERGAYLAPGGAAPSDLDLRLQVIDQREKDLVTRENELRQRFEEIRIRSEELDRRRNPIEVKERELASYDQQLQSRKQALDVEARRLEGLHQDEAGGPGVVDDGTRLEELRASLAAREDDLRNREEALRERATEVEKLAGKAAESGGEAGRDEVAREAAEVKVKTGIRRLDDLLYGGLPVGAQLLVNGPAHTGKDVLARLFSVEGLKLGIPSIWIVTDKTWGQVREDLVGLYPKYEEAEKGGMVRFVDLYSRSVGSSGSTPGVRLLSSTDKGVLDQLAQTVNSISEELKSKFPTYRLVFESVSTLTAYLDTSATFRFLQPLIGRRKIDQAVAYYVLDRGMHSDADLETLEHMVDGSINLKIEQLKTFLSVKGIGETQSRAWIGYTFTKRSLNLGSFSLDHIR